MGNISFQKFLSRRAIYMYKYVENFVEFVLSLFFCSLSMLQEKNIVASSNRSVPVNSVSLRDMNQSEGALSRRRSKKRVIYRCGKRTAIYV